MNFLKHITQASKASEVCEVNAERSLISISLSPNTKKDDVCLALALLFQPWIWKQIKNGAFCPLIELEKEFKKYFNVKEAISFNSGRSALLAILDSLNLEKGSEVLVQAFTCNAAVNPIIWAGLKPVYVDCDEKTFNIDIDDLKKKITLKTRAVMVQHTFGLPADMDRILEVCQKHSLILIEDCAHSLGAEYKSKKVGTFGKVAFFSFSRDKVISSVYGGMAVTNDNELAEKIRAFQQKIGYPSSDWILQQLLHPILMNWPILPTYKFFGKYLLILFQWLHILSKAVHWKEKRAKKPEYFPKRLPSALACLALNQFKKLNKFNQHRKKVANFYFEKLKNTNFELPETQANVVSEASQGKALLFPSNYTHIFLRFTIKHPKAHEIIKKAWRKNLLIGDWYTSPIAPNDTKLAQLQYKFGSCPKAEKISKQTLNLPTHINISKKEAQKIVNFLLLNEK